MSINEERLREYKKKLLELKNEGRLDQYNLDEVAMDIGLTVEDLKKINDIILENKQRGEAFLKHKCWNDAILEFEKAIILSPFNIDIIYGLAKAYCEKWLVNKNKDDKKKSYEYAKSSLNIDPLYEPSLKIIKILNKKEKKINPKTRKKIFYLIFFLTVVFFLLIIYIFKDFRLNIKKNEEYLSSGNNSSKKNEETNENFNIINTDTVEDPGKYEVPVYLTQSDKEEGVVIHVQSSILNIYDDSFSYNIYGNFISDKYEIHMLNVKMNFLGEDNEVLYTEYINVLDESDTYIYPNDTIPFEKLVFKKERPPKIKKILLLFDIVKKLPGKNYEEGKPTRYTWEAENSLNAKFAIYQRENSTVKSFGFHYRTLVLRFKNTGTRSIKELKVKIKWYDKKNKHIKTETSFIVFPQGPYLEPGQVRVATLITDFPENADPDHYTVSITDVK